MKKWLYKIEEINELFDSGKDIVVYGAGDYGKKLIDYALFWKKERYIKKLVVTKLNEEGTYRGIPVVEVKAECFTKKCVVIVATSWMYQEDIEQLLMDMGVLSYCLMTAYFYNELDRHMDARRVVPFSGIDFVCAGFSKCGTTSLHAFFRQCEDVYVPEKLKESQFFNWCDAVIDAEKRLADNFFDNIKDGQIVGIVEPGMNDCPEKICQKWGRDVKIIFVLRNPVEGLFSWLKMGFRLAIGSMEAFYGNNGKFAIENLENISKNQKYKAILDIYEYIEWIEKFEKVFLKENIKIVLFEELIKNPTEQLNAILEFIGARPVENAQFPKVNEGDWIPACVDELPIVKCWSEYFHQKPYLNESNMELLHESEVSGYKLAMAYEELHKVKGLRMTAQLRNELEAYYFESVRRLEKRLDKKLSKVWF